MPKEVNLELWVQLNEVYWLQEEAIHLCTSANEMLMVTLDEIEAAIHNLPENEARILANRLQVYLDDLWDSQLEADLESGKLDALISRAEGDIAENRVRDLNEVLHNT